MMRQWPNLNGMNGQSTAFLLGSIVQGQDMIIGRLDKIEGRLEEGHLVFTAHGSRIESLERDRLARAAEKRLAPRSERIAKRWVATLTLIVSTVTVVQMLLGVISPETAAKVVDTLK